jgi:aspartate racemase
MKCLGIIGGHGVETTAHYARQIENEIWERFEDRHTANLLALSLQTKQLGTLLAKEDWRAISHALGEAATNLRSLGAESVLLCSSFLHVAAGGVPAGLSLLHITDPTVAALKRAKLKRIGLIGTRHPDEEALWRRRLAQAGIHDVFLPVPRDRQHLVKLITDQFERGIVNEEARADVVRIVYSLRQAGARAAVVCVPALTAILEDAVPVLPLLDASELHALAAVDWMGANIPPPGPVAMVS